MANEPHAIRRADEAWGAIYRDVAHIKSILEAGHRDHRSAVFEARSTGEDPRGIMDGGNPSGVMSTFHVKVQVGDKKVERDFTIVYDPPAGSCCYLVQPSTRDGSQIISADESLPDLPKIVRGHIYRDLVAMMEEADPSAGCVVNVEPARDPDFGRVVMVEFTDDGERIVSTQPIECFRAEQEREYAPSM